MNAKGGRKDGMNWKTGVGTHPLLCIKWASQVALMVKNLPVNVGHKRRRFDSSDVFMVSWLLERVKGQQRLRKWPVTVLAEAAVSI